MRWRHKKAWLRKHVKRVSPSQHVAPGHARRRDLDKFLWWVRWPWRSAEERRDARRQLMDCACGRKVSWTKFERCPRCGEAVVPF